MKAAERYGFDPGCPHDLDLLPVIDFSHNYQCLKCGGIIRVPWHKTTAGMNTEQLREHAEQVIALESEHETPEFTARHTTT